MAETVFEKFEGVADRLLEKFGQPSTVRRVTYPDSAADGKVVPTSQDFPIRAAQSKSMFKTSEGLTKYKATLVIRGKEVEVGDFVYWGLEWLEIMESEPVNPTGGFVIITKIGVDNIKDQGHVAPV